MLPLSWAPFWEGLEAPRRILQLLGVSLDGPGTWGGFWRFETLLENVPSTMSVAIVELSWHDGNSPGSLDMTIETLSDEVLRAIRAMDLENFVISGHSIGGMIAVEIAGREVAGLVGAIPMEVSRNTSSSRGRKFKAIITSWRKMSTGLFQSLLTCSFRIVFSPRH